jgi:hypothetical protein
MVVVAASVNRPLSSTDREWCRREGILSRRSEPTQLGPARVRSITNVAGDVDA